MLTKGLFAARRLGDGARFVIVSEVYSPQLGGFQGLGIANSTSERQKVHKAYLANQRARILLKIGVPILQQLA